MNRSGAALLAVLLAATAGCREQARQRRQTGATATVIATSNVSAADADWSCGAVHDTRPLERTLGTRGRFLLGAIADTHAALPSTIAQLERFAAQFSARHVDAVAALGDLGRSSDDVAAVLTALRAARAPILAIAGERESENSFHEGVKRARNNGVDVIDLVDKRLINGEFIDIVSLPGYPFTKRGCRYRARDLDGVRALVARRDRRKPLVMLGHMPPRGDGETAIDWAFGNMNVGDRDVARLVDELQPVIGLFAHVDEAGGHARATGKQLLLNVGGADAIDVARAFIVEFSDGNVKLEALP